MKQIDSIASGIAQQSIKIISRQLYLSTTVCQYIVKLGAIQEPRPCPFIELIYQTDDRAVTLLPRLQQLIEKLLSYSIGNCRPEGFKK